MGRLIVVSADCHADPARIDTYGDYLESEYQDEYRGYVERLRESLGEDGKGTGHSREAYFSADHREKLKQAVKDRPVEEGSALAALGSNLSLTADPDVRLKDLEDDGIVCEVIFVNTAWPFAPMGLQAFRSPPRAGELASREFELETAGKRAWHRWLGELCQAHPGRRVGVGVLFPVSDIDEAVADVEFMRGVGLGGVMCPPPSLDAPPLWDRFYDPLWAKCAELRMPVHFHTGWGVKVDPRISYRRPGSPDYDPGMVAIDDIERMWLARRPLWLLTLSGVLDRHPELKLAFTELNADWVGTYLAQMDVVYSDYLRSARMLTESLSMAPSEFWKRQCFLGASSTSRAEVEIRHETHVETMMFGSDYPHNEGTWPTTMSWLARVFEGVPEDEVRMMLGENAMRCYDLDRAQLQTAADRCGPTLEEITGGSRNLGDDTTKWLDDRGAARPLAFI